MRWLIGISLGILTAPQLVRAADVCEPGGWKLGFQLENDMRALSIFDPSDKAYTNGARIDLAGKSIDPSTGGPFRTVSPFRRETDACYRIGFSLGLLMYTPNNIETADVQRFDRPYGAWIHGSYQLTKYKIRESDVRRADTFEIDLGLLGPGAGGRWFQDRVHALFNIPSAVGQPYKRPLGWHHQLRNEPGVAARLSRRYRAAGPRATVRDRRWDLLAHGGGVVGNVFTGGSGGGTLRFGRHVPNDLGPQQTLYSVPITADTPAQPPTVSLRPTDTRASTWSWYVFAGIEGRLVLRNAFLDGNFFVADRPDRGVVQKQPFVADLDLGGVLRIGWFRITYHNVTRTSEFKRPPAVPPGTPINNQAHRYGSVAVMYGRGR